jgi:hypothetical protein
MIITRILFFMLLTTAVWAADAPDFTKDPAIGVKRVMTKDPKTTDSQCVGDPKTPVCAMETMLACLVRQEPDLCRKVGVRRGCFDKKLYKAVYIFNEISIEDKYDLPPHLAEKYLDTDLYIGIGINIFLYYSEHNIPDESSHFILSYKNTAKSEILWKIPRTHFGTALCDGLDSDD